VLNGIAYRRTPSALVMRGTAYGSLPTPTATDGGPDREDKPRSHGMNLAGVLKHRSLPSLPTPTAFDAVPAWGPRNQDGKRHGGGNSPGLRHLAALPTPRATDADKGGRGDLLTVLRGYETKHAGTLPTPTARDWRSGLASEETHSTNSRPLNEVVARMSGNRSGRMNPRFREWMMRLPIGWTERKPPEIL